MPRQSHALFGCWKQIQVATSHVHHIEDKNDFIESKNQAAKNNKYVKPQKKTQKKSKHASEDSNIFKINCNKTAETQERREKNRNRKFPQLTIVCPHGHMSYSVSKVVSGCIPELHHIEV